MPCGAALQPRRQQLQEAAQVVGGHHAARGRRGAEGQHRPALDGAQQGAKAGLHAGTVHQRRAHDGQGQAATGVRFAQHTLGQVLGFGVDALRRLRRVFGQRRRAGIAKDLGGRHEHEPQRPVRRRRPILAHGEVSVDAQPRIAVAGRRRPMRQCREVEDHAAGIGRRAVIHGRPPCAHGPTVTGQHAVEVPANEAGRAVYQRLQGAPHPIVGLGAKEAKASMGECGEGAVLNGERRVSTVLRG